MIKQTIILTNNINESEKLKSLSLLGEKTFNTRYMSTLDLANHLLELSGITHNLLFISNDDLSAIIYKDVKNIKYFEKLSFDDVLHLVNSINELRRHIVKNESESIHDLLPMDVFKEKNEAIIKAYDAMMVAINSRGAIDEVGIIRFALENIKAFPDINFVIYENSSVLDYSLDMALLDKAHGSVVKPTKICDPNTPLHIDSYLKAFGQTNEIESVISYIYKNKIPFDQCVIASAETNDYSNVLRNYADVLKFPLTIGTGTILIETNPGKLFSMINDWIDSHYHSDYLKVMINDLSFNVDKLKEHLMIPDSFDDINKQLEYPEQISFDSIVKTVGDLRMSFDASFNNKKLENYKNLLNEYNDKQYNKENTDRRLAEIPYVERFVETLNEGMINFIKEYSKITDEPKDLNAILKIAKALVFEGFGIPYNELKKTIFNQKVGRQSSEVGKLYFTSISNASSALRPYLFIVGLSSNNFPGSSKEDSFLLDRDFEAFGVSNYSNKDIESNKNSFFNLIKEAKKHDVHIHLSYAYYNSQTLKEQNASSVVFETYKLENGDKKTIKDLEDEFGKSSKYRVVEYFDNHLLPVDQIGNAINENKKIKFEKLEMDPTEQQVELDFMLNKAKGFSASAVTQYAKCPYLFYLAQVLRIPQPEEIDIYQIIPPNDLGTMAHYLLENLDKTVIKNPEEFGKVASKAFDDYLIMHQADNMTLANKAKDEFVDMMKTAYVMEGNDKTLFREEDITCVHPSGIRIHGFPDKVVENPDGTVTIIDYKTGRAISHDASDIPSMIQCTIYSFIVEERKKRHVSGFEYWYLRHNTRIFSGDDGKTMTDHYNNLNTVLNNLFNSLKSGTFTPNHSNCDNCYYKDVCPRKKAKK